MKSPLLIIFSLMATANVVWAERCEAGVCAAIPGLVYNAELDQCAWPDEVDCSLQDLGYNVDCSDVAAFGLKAADFELANLPAGHDPKQYFVVCVPRLTESDRSARTLYATGPVTPRLLGCPIGTVFNTDTKQCQ